jgi:hypothetical protein
MSDQTDNKHPRGKRYTEDMIIRMLKDCNALYGRVTVDEFARQSSYCNVETVIRKFGSWKSAKQKAQINTDTQQPLVPGQYSKEQIRSHLRELHRRYGDACPVFLNREDDLVDTLIVFDAFGSWEEALRQSGLADE